jgi:hypothetical protein
VIDRYFSRKERLYLAALESVHPQLLESRTDVDESRSGLDPATTMFDMKIENDIEGPVPLPLGGAREPLACRPRMCLKFEIMPFGPTSA